MKYFCLPAFFLFVVFTSSHAQTSRNPAEDGVKSPLPERPEPEANSSKKEKKGFLFFGKKKKDKPSPGYNRYFDRKVEEYYERMEEAAKRYERMQKEMQKPQYSDPMYFGHKKKPKKRPPGKKKFCTECGIVH